MRIGHVAGKSKKSRVDQLQHLGGHAHILRDQVADFVDRRVGRAESFGHREIQCGKAGHGLHPADDLFQVGIVKHVAQAKRARQPLLEFIDVAGLGQILVAGAHRTQNGIAVRLPGKNDANGAGETWS